MRYSYGIVDKKKILLYQPQLFLRRDEILIFPSRDFHAWYGDIKEYLDSLYQINAKNIGESEPISLTELTLAVGIINELAEELECLFDCENKVDLSYQYISTMAERYKKLSSNYSSDMRKCDIRIPVKPEITPYLKYQHIMEIIRHAEREFERSRSNLKDKPKNSQ
jgi:hypothetical protein